MTFQPVIPLTGYTGWLFLDRTADQQRTTFNEGAEITRTTESFRDRISTIQTAEDLVADRELLSVALGAFGLDDDIDNTFFIRKVLEEGTVDTDSLANKLSDSSYAEFSEAFGFGSEEVTRTGLPFFTDEIIDRYEAEQFEIAVGEQDNDLRLALNLGADITDLVEDSTSDTADWFGMMGNTALRTMFETALGFSSSFGSIDLDQQLEQFQSRAKATFGTDVMSELASEDNQEKLIRLYLVRSEANAITAASGGSIALQLLQGL